jgi:acetyltransferase-like isoleucine patch superfamily enzyme
MSRKRTLLREMSEYDSDPVAHRGRLASSAPGAWLDGIWRKANQRLVVSGKVEVGRASRLSLGATVWSAHGLVIGDYCAIGRRSTINADGRIGHFFMTGSHVAVLGRVDHAIDEIGVPMLLSEWIGDRDKRADDEVEIGDDVWLGSGAIVLGGVQIGDGAIVGAGSVVTHDVPAFGVAVGNPARVIRHRFTDEDAALHLKKLESLHASLTRGR